jgi:hypothetical protein
MPLPWMHATRSDTMPLKAARRAVGVWREAVGRAEPRTTPADARGANVMDAMMTRGESRGCWARAGLQSARSWPCNRLAHPQWLAEITHDWLQVYGHPYRPALKY